MYVKVSGKPRFDAKGAFLGYRGTGNDVTAAVRADQAEAALRQVQAELVHVARVTSLGELAASIAHEVTQPIAATLTNAQAALRWLRLDPPEQLDEVQKALERIVRDAARAGAVVQRIRNLVKKAPPHDDRVDINAAIREVIELTRSEAMKNGVLMRTELADSLPVARGDRVELQQVILNLVLNAVEAMSALTEGPRELQIVTSRTESDHTLIAVRDTGPGLAPAAEENLFKAFHTTKPNGLGLGLSICRSIVESRGGRMWASANAPRGAVFQFTLPVHPDIAT
jgi:C4-dicarboxylate-specific signal transduction histidine kinase